jgi:hypothetical protein
MAARLRGTVLVAAAFGALAVGEPRELHGNRLGDHTGLRLVVAGKPPFVFDVDSGAVTRLKGVGTTLDVIGASSGAVVVVAEPGTPVTNKRLWIVRSGATAPSPIGSGRDVAVAAGGAGVWVTRLVSRKHCALLRIGVDGRRSAARAIPCSWIIAPAGTLGLVVHRTRIIDPRTGRKVIGTRQGVLAVAGRRVLLASGVLHTPGYHFTLLDTVTGARHRFAWPSILAGLDAPGVDPRGRYIAMAFADPSYQLSGSQVLDVWVLDTATAKLTHLPGTPAYVSLKGTNIAWTHDGRLVLLGEEDGRAFVGVWRPGEKRISLKSVPLPLREGATDAFAPLR